MCVMLPTPTVLLLAMHLCSTITDTRVFSTAMRKLCNQDVACQQLNKCSLHSATHGKEWDREESAQGEKTKLKNTRKLKNMFWGIFPILSDLKVWAKIHSPSCQCISLILFVQLLLVGDIKNLVGKEQKMMQLRTILSVKQCYNFSMWIFDKNFNFSFVLYWKDGKK